MIKNFEEFSNEKIDFSSLLKRNKTSKKANKTYSELDPYGEESWDDDNNSIKSRLFKLNNDINDKKSVSRMYFKVNDNKYILTSFIDNNNNCILSSDFENGLKTERGFITLSKKLINHLIPVNDDEYTIFLNKMYNNNIYFNRSDKNDDYELNDTNIELFKNLFID
jgi:hypothetical protein